MKNKKHLLTLTIIAFIIASAFLVLKNWRRPGESKTFTITLSEDGFEPKEISIHKGDTVKFVNQTKEFFWPASDLHPSHKVYSDFDPKEPLPAGDIWSFTFDQVGEWKFHDHLSPYYKGIITVKSEKRIEKFSCKNTNDVRCTRDQVIKIFKTQGLDEAIKLINLLSKEDIVFTQTCHTLAHEIGKETYKLYKEGEEIDLSPKASFCAFGFYHGFMEDLYLDTADLSQAREFCQMVDNQLSKDTPDVGLQCFHGIGHGVVGTHDSLLWGDEIAMSEPALKLCEDVSQTDDELYRCTSGVYNGIANFYMYSDYNLQINKEDPLWFCRQQPTEYQEACFGNFNTTLLWMSDDDFTKASKFLSNLPLKLKITSIRYLSTHNALINLGKNNFTQNIGQCHLLDNDLQISCVEGYAGGLIEHGSLEDGYEPAIEFCSHPDLSAPQSDACFAFATTYFKSWYSQEVVDDICQLLEKRYNKTCN